MAVMQPADQIAGRRGWMFHECRYRSLVYVRRETNALAAQLRVTSDHHGRWPSPTLLEAVLAGGRDGR